MNDKYNPKDFEEKLYEQWEKKGYFKPSMDKTKESYCIMMPPPNVTGKLHMGHALDDTMQDILIRFKRMQGYKKEKQNTTQEEKNLSKKHGNGLDFMEEPSKNNKENQDVLVTGKEKDSPQTKVYQMLFQSNL